VNRTIWTAIFGLTYLLLLFAVAYWADWARRKGRSPVDNPWVYSLSLAVYCTSWTFYGSVGRAASAGLGFLPIYLGPTLLFLLAPSILRRLVSFCNSQGVTSVPDLLEAMYGKGKALGTIATLILVIGVIPYISLQLKAVGHTFDLLTTRGPAPGVFSDAAFWASLVLAIFSVLFGARTLVASERHEGMVAAVALESAVKLGAFLIVGAHIVWGLGGGLGNIFSEAQAAGFTSKLFLLGGESPTSGTQWLTLMVLSASAVILLPRQFQMLAVENVREDHLLPASWVFPAYLFVINLLVLPVALVGLIHKIPGTPDYFMISIPLSQGQKIFAFMSFIGGLSAATSMIIVSSVALSTMILHHLISPWVLKIRMGHQDMSRFLLQAKRVAILAVILLGYGFNRWIGESYTLVSIGLISFSAVTQFAPAVLLGLFWKGGNRGGALVGLILGFAVWVYTLLLPSFAESGWLDMGFLIHGPWGIELLRPRALFGFEGLDVYSHALVWSMVFNLGGYLAWSLLGEERHLHSHLDFTHGAGRSRGDLQEFLGQFVGEETAKSTLDAVPEPAPPLALIEAAERCLAGAVGTASARTIIKGFLVWNKEHSVEVLDVFGGVTQTLADSRETLERRLRELSVLHKASKSLAQGLDTDAFLNKILGLIRQEFGLDHLAVRLLQPDGSLHIRCHVGLTQRYVEASALTPSRETFFGRCFLDAQPLVVENIRDVIKESKVFKVLLENVSVMAFIHVPMMYEERPMGVLTAYATRGPMHFTKEFIDLFAALANQLALAVINAQLYTEVQAYSQAMEHKVQQRTIELVAANERLQELDRLKSEFLSTVSHELRTPLTSIRSFSEILLRYGVDDPAKRTKFLTIINTESKRLTNMINELLDLSKIEAGKVEFDLVSVDLAEILSECLEISQLLFEEKGVSLVMDVESGLPSVLVDHDRLHQIMTNLLANASNFSPEKGEVLVEAKRKGDFAEVSVADQGPGIPEDRLPEIFEPFGQIHDPQKKKPRGTGLGLKISKEIVNRMGGKIWVESVLGAGTTFFFTVPLKGFGSKTLNRINPEVRR
jgi:sigma-B regulation protein RsbU (phosphoserine phosphatase)